MRCTLGKRLVFVVVALAVLAGCDGQDNGGKPTTLPPDPPVTTTIDVSKVPTIDVPYVQAVMDALDKVTGDAVRIFVAQRGPNQEWYEIFRAVFEDKAFELAQSDFGRYAANQLTPLRPSPGNPTTVVKRVIDSSANCVVAQVDRSYGPIFTTTPGNPAGYIQLALKKPQNDPRTRNPTVWAIVADINIEGAQIPEDPCK